MPSHGVGLAGGERPPERGLLRGDRRRRRRPRRPATARPGVVDAVQATSAMACSTAMTDAGAYDPLPGAGDADERDDLGVRRAPRRPPGPARRVAAEQLRARRPRPRPGGRTPCAPPADRRGRAARRRARRARRSVESSRGDAAGRRPSGRRRRTMPARVRPDLGELGLPAGHQVGDRLVPLGAAGGAGGDRRGPGSCRRRARRRRRRSRRPAWRTPPPPRRGCRRSPTGRAGPTGRRRRSMP